MDYIKFKRLREKYSKIKYLIYLFFYGKRKPMKIKHLWSPIHRRKK